MKASISPRSEYHCFQYTSRKRRPLSVTQSDVKARRSKGERIICRPAAVRRWLRSSQESATTMGRAQSFARPLSRILAQILRLAFTIILNVRDNARRAAGAWVANKTGSRGRVHYDCSATPDSFNSETRQSPLSAAPSGLPQNLRARKAGARTPVDLQSARSHHQVPSR